MTRATEKMHPRGRRSRRLALVTLAAIAFVGTLLLVELSVRAVFPSWAPRTARMTTFWQYNAKYGWAHVPGVSGRFKSVGFDIAVRINANGFRGREVPYARSGSSQRVLVLGDSHVWGFGVDEETTFCRLLERMIPDLEVVNLGVSGYSTDQELLLYQEEGYRYAADVIIVFVAHNDLRANTRTIESSVYGKPRFVLNGNELVLENHPVPPPSWLKRVAFDLSTRSYLLTRALRVLDESRRAADVSLGPPRPPANQSAERKRDESPFPRTPGQRITTHLLLELQRSVSQKQPSAQLLVVFADLRNGLGDQAGEYLRQFGVPSLALDSHIHPMDPAWHLPDGLHWTAAGHQKVAEVLADQLRPLLPDAALDTNTKSAGSTH